MDINLIFQLILSQLIPLVVGTSMLAHPELQGDALERQIDGDLRHATRSALGPAGFMADFLWSYAPLHEQIGSTISLEITKLEIAKVEAQRQDPGSTISQPTISQQAFLTVGAQEQDQSPALVRQETAGMAPAVVMGSMVVGSQEPVPHNLTPDLTPAASASLPPHFVPPPDDLPTNVTPPTNVPPTLPAA